MSLIDLIKGAVGDQLADAVSGQQGVDKGQFSALAAKAAPLIVNKLQQNAKSSPEEAANINQALKSHDGSILDNLGNINQADGSSILDHIFGGDRSNVEQKLAGDTGISLDKIGPLLSSLAPVIMGYIGKQKADAQAANNTGGIGDLLGGILGGNGGNLGSAASEILGGKSKSGGILGSLFNMFKK